MLQRPSGCPWRPWAGCVCVSVHLRPCASACAHWCVCVFVPLCVCVWVPAFLCLYLDACVFVCVPFPVLSMSECVRVCV